MRKLEEAQGVLCDRNMPVKLNGNIQNSGKASIGVWGQRQSWSTTKSQEKRLEVNEMRMPRWMWGVMRKDKIRSEHARGSVKVAPVTKKITEKRLKLYGRTGHDKVEE